MVVAGNYSLPFHDVDNIITDTYCRRRFAQCFGPNHRRLIYVSPIFRVLDDVTVKNEVENAFKIMYDNIEFMIYCIIEFSLSRYFRNEVHLRRIMSKIDVDASINNSGSHITRTVGISCLFFDD